VTYTFTVQIGSSAAGTLSNTATVSVPAGDNTPQNNSAADVDTLTPQSDVSITVTDNATTAVPGIATTYTILVSNCGPSPATGLSVNDALPAGATSASWSGDGHVSVSGALADMISSLAPGASITYTFTVQVGSSATGSLSDTATVSVPSGDNTP